MSPDRVKVIGSQKVEEFYWAGRQVVYVDNCLSKDTFDEACSKLEESTATVA